MEEQVVVKITMPKQYAKKFMKESDDYFYGSRFINLLYKESFRIFNNKWRNQLYKIGK